MFRGLLATCLVCLSLISSGCGGPLGPFSGGALSGDEAPLPSNWTAVSDVEQVQLETRPTDPYSVNTWIGVVDGNLYIPTSLIMGDKDPAQRAWVQHVQDNPHIRLRVGDNIYPLKATRILDSDAVDKVKRALLLKYGEESTPHSDQAWIYSLTAR